MQNHGKIQGWHCIVISSKSANHWAPWYTRTFQNLLDSSGGVILIWKQAQHAQYGPKLPKTLKTNQLLFQRVPLHFQQVELEKHAKVVHCSLNQGSQTQINTGETGNRWFKRRSAISINKLVLCGRAAQPYKHWQQTNTVYKQKKTYLRVEFPNVV